MASKKQPPADRQPRISNRKARHNYQVIEVLECGLELTGTEVKSLRAGQAKIDEAYARIRNGELYLIGATISHYPQAAEGMQHDQTRDRRLLARRSQIARLDAHVRQKGKTIVPLALYFRRGWAKVELGVAVGKRRYDKREALRKRDQQRDIDREMRGRRRRR